MRRNWLALAIILGAAGLVGCGGSKDKEAPTPSIDKKAPGADGAAGVGNISAAMVTDTGGIDDQSFNSGCWAGLQKAQKDLGIKVKYVESKEQADYKTNLSSLAEGGADLVVAVGFMMEDACKEAATSYPKVKFAIVDGSAPKLPNAVSLKFREEEGSFIAGYLAGSMSKKNAVGFVGGVESELLKKFESGFAAGAKTAKPGIKFLAKYVGSWTDNAKGQVMAQQMFGEADILFAAAGKSGLGVIDAAGAMPKGFYAIGVDSDQDHIQKGHVLTSMMKGVDTAVFEAAKAVKDGKFAAGEIVLGVKEGGVHLSPMTYTKADVPADVLKKLDTIKGMIADGKIKVPKTDAELAAFKAPSL